MGVGGVIRNKKRSPKSVKLKEIIIHIDIINSHPPTSTSTTTIEPSEAPAAMYFEFGEAAVAWGGGVKLEKL